MALNETSIETHRTCKKCGIVYPLDNFIKHPYKAGLRCNECKPCAKIYAAAYYLKNKERLKEMGKKWRAKNQEVLKRIAERNKHKSPIYSRNRKEKNKNNPVYKLIIHHRVRINQALRSAYKKSDNSMALLGCSPRQAVFHLTNGGYLIPEGFHIDHHVPIAFFDLSKEHEQRVCFNYRNLKLLSAKENLKKGKSLPTDYREKLDEICKALGITIQINGLKQ